MRFRLHVHTTGIPEEAGKWRGVVYMSLFGQEFDEVKLGHWARRREEGGGTSVSTFLSPFSLLFLLSWPTVAMGKDRDKKRYRSRGNEGV